MENILEMQIDLWCNCKRFVLTAWDKPPLTLIDNNVIQF